MKYFLTSHSSMLCAHIYLINTRFIPVLNGFVFVCGTGGWFRGSPRGHRRVVLGRHYDNVNSSMSSTRRRCRFGGVFVTGRTGGFLLRKSSAASGAGLRRDDCNFAPVNNLWALDDITHTDIWTVIPLYSDIVECLCLYFSFVFCDVKYFYY